MFARILEFVPKMEKKEEFIRVVKNEVLPILRKQHGFMEFLPFFPEVKNEKVVTISLWSEKKDAERYEREWFPKVEEILKPYLTTPGWRTSIPNSARPQALSAESNRFISLPTIRNCFGSLSFTSLGTGSFPAASARLP
jgi:quinol monooxygenase YgiN